MLAQGLIEAVAALAQLEAENARLREDGEQQMLRVVSAVWKATRDECDQQGIKAGQISIADAAAIAARQALGEPKP